MGSYGDKTYVHVLVRGGAQTRAVDRRAPARQLTVPMHAQGEQIGGRLLQRAYTPYTAADSTDPIRKGGTFVSHWSAVRCTVQPSNLARTAYNERVGGRIVLRGTMAEEATHWYRAAQRAVAQVGQTTNAVGGRLISSGGSWSGPLRYVRTTSRFTTRPDSSQHDHGIRLCRRGGALTTSQQYARCAYTSELDANTVDILSLMPLPDVSSRLAHGGAWNLGSSWCTTATQTEVQHSAHSVGARLIRGGSFRSHDTNRRSPNRDTQAVGSTYVNTDLGVRVVCGGSWFNSPEFARNCGGTVINMTMAAGMAGARMVRGGSYVADTFANSTLFRQIAPAAAAVGTLGGRLLLTSVRLRGASWLSATTDLSSACRVYASRTLIAQDTGARLVRTATAAVIRGSSFRTLTELTTAVFRVSHMGDSVVYEIGARLICEGRGTC
jgi:hypothetical protein